MDIQDGEKKINQLDSFLTALEKLLKKHWLILLLIGMGAFIYWAWNLPESSTSNEQQTTEQQDTSNYYQDDTTYYDSLTE